jgi:yecA family protein
MLLKAFLAHPDLPEGTLQYHEVQGFLFAVLSAPDVVMPSEWIPAIFADGQTEFADLDEAMLIHGELVALYNSINADITGRDDASLPDDCRFRDDILANFDDDAPVSLWSRGFRIGYEWLEDSWAPYLTGELDEESGPPLLILTFFSSRALAEAYCVELGRHSLDDVATSMRELFPEAMFEHASLGRCINRC